MNEKDVNVAKLAGLARLQVSKADLVKLEEEIPTILEFVETIQKVSTPKETASTGLHNVMRSDEAPHETGLYTEDLLAAAPEQKDGRVVVKQVISRKKIA